MTMTFGEKLQKLRLREGMSQERLAELLDVSRQAVSRWERDETMPETEKIVRISDYFQVTTDYLLKDVQEQVSPSRRVPDLEGWYREKGYQLGYLVIAIGLYHTLRLAWGAVTLGSFGSGYAAVWYLICYVFPALEVVVGGLLTATLGRRLSGHLRWYHLGWVGILIGVGGLIWLAVRHLAAWFLQAAGMMTEQRVSAGVCLIFACLLFVGSGIVYLGRRK
jgi:transcriptional regulator with XRE-family HTH domain